ncbi:MAG: lipocalin family protein [Bacteroidota bacterium]
MRNLFLYLLISSTLLACGADPKSDIDANLLTGKWQLKEATKNGSPTVMLGDLYFDFDEAGKMQTNMPTMDGASEYELNGSTIEQRSDQVKNDYEIESLTATELILMTEIQGMAFRLSLNKSEE